MLVCVSQPLRVKSAPRCFICDELIEASQAVCEHHLSSCFNTTGQEPGGLFTHLIVFAGQREGEWASRDRFHVIKVSLSAGRWSRCRKPPSVLTFHTFQTSENCFKAFSTCSICQPILTHQSGFTLWTYLASSSSVPLASLILQLALRHVRISFSFQWQTAASCDQMITKQWAFLQDLTRPLIFSGFWVKNEGPPKPSARPGVTTSGSSGLKAADIWLKKWHISK